MEQVTADLRFESIKVVLVKNGLVHILLMKKSKFLHLMRFKHFARISREFKTLLELQHV